MSKLEQPAIEKPSTAEKEQVQEIKKETELKSNNFEEQTKENQDQKPLEQKPDTEKKLDKVDQMFDELLEKIKDAPELKQEALKAAITQFRQIAEQMKQVRDMKNFQETKKLMLQHWQELNELTKGDPKLLESIQEWGVKFNEEKVIYYDLINEVKDELIDKAQDIQVAWDDMTIELGQICGLLEHKGNTIMQLYLNQSRKPFNFQSGMEKFIENLTAVETGYDNDDILINEANGFLENINGVIMKLSQASQGEKIILEGDKVVKKTYIELYPEIRELLKSLQEKKALLSKRIKETSKIYKVTKKIRDTHFLKLYSEQPEPEQQVA